MKSILLRQSQKRFFNLLKYSCFILPFVFICRISFAQLPDGHQEFILEHDDLQRKFIIYLPSAYDNEQEIPLVIAIHGGGGSAEGSIHYFELTQKAEEEKFIIAYPQGFAIKVLGKNFGSWNGGNCCGPALKNNIDDVGFIRKMILQIEKDFKVDPKRVYATGMSNGAIMSYALACELSDKIAAIAPVGSIGHYKQCEPQYPVPVLHIHGIDDPCAVYEGCTDCQGCSAKFMKSMGLKFKENRMDVESVTSFLDKHRQINGCSYVTKETFKNKGATCLEYQNCDNNADVILCSVKGLGHTWPGRTTYSAKSCDFRPNGFLCRSWINSVGQLNQDINANDMIWEFFQNHPKNY
ncbi:MAG: hypothetical protein KKD07_01525 [Candidatus Omnitrophica bacterium]|nr:hypothetical protein [Candidatus Omnitrophota bacterium]MBU1997400.1 hypothetical protein [Candidatus Omnitrophota bacterium]MBU4333102.1 hypothetical protein [Candidatus Omnitrophota bacterium]